MDVGQIGWELERHYLQDGTFKKVPGSWEREQTLLDPNKYQRLPKPRPIEVGDRFQHLRSGVVSQILSVKTQNHLTRTWYMTGWPHAHSWEFEEVLLDPKKYLRLPPLSSSSPTPDPTSTPTPPPALRGCTNDEITYLRTLVRQLDLIGLSSMLNLANNEILARGCEERRRGR